MAPNTTSVDDTTQQFEQLDLKKLAREVGSYSVYPETTYPPLEPFEHQDPGRLADPEKRSLYDNAEKVFNLTPALGTEIHGIQLSQLTDQQKNDLSLLAAERGVVFFRNQNLDPYQAVELGRYFGRLHIHNTSGHPPNLPEVISIFYDEKNPQTLKYFEGISADQAWHSDITYENQPAGLTFLKLDTLPDVGGDTLWASAYEAYDRLSAPMKKFLEGLEAIHTGQVHNDRVKRSGTYIRREFVDSTHPIVRVHPLTGWKGLFVQPGFTKQIVGLSRKESDLILKFLFSHISGGHDFQLRFKWSEDTIAVWDNRCTFHCAIFDYFEEGRRHGWRVTPTAERPRYDPKGKSRREDLAEKKKAKEQQQQ
ncbi:TauD-domain-containing protein [Backusella circina FSU 941]|nr:TauD-domain-containing protein [Backusella circina FSU 941]